MKKHEIKSVKKLTKKYIEWLNNQQWFSLKIASKNSWFEPLYKIVDDENLTASAAWEAVVDHWMETSWQELENAPTMFQELYTMVDEIRLSIGCTSTNDAIFTYTPDLSDPLCPHCGCKAFGDYDDPTVEWLGSCQNGHRERYQLEEG